VRAPALDRVADVVGEVECEIAEDSESRVVAVTLETDRGRRVLE
jgi:hypothetical protein